MSVAGRMENTEIYEFLKLDTEYPIKTLELQSSILKWNEITL